MERYMKLVGPFLIPNLLGKTQKNWSKVEKKITPLDNYSTDTCWQIIII